MARDADPLELLASPHDTVSGATLLQPEKRLEAPNLDHFDSLQPMQWDIPETELAIIDGGLFHHMDCPPDSQANIIDTDCYSRNYTGLLNHCPVNDSSNWQQPTPSPDSPENREVYCSQCSTRDQDSNLRKECPHRDKRIRYKFNPYSSPPSHDEEIGIDEKHKDGEKRVKNRIAASRCRKKKKREEEILQSRAKGLEAERDALKSRTEGLRLEVLSLKNEVLRHAGCDCEVIRKYISEAARQIA